MQAAQAASVRHHASLSTQLHRVIFTPHRLRMEPVSCTSPWSKIAPARRWGTDDLCNTFIWRNCNGGNDEVIISIMQYELLQPAINVDNEVEARSWKLELY